MKNRLLFVFSLAFSCSLGWAEAPTVFWKCEGTCHVKKTGAELSLASYNYEGQNVDAVIGLYLNACRTYGGEISQAPSCASRQDMPFWLTDLPKEPFRWFTTVTADIEISSSANPGTRTEKRTFPVSLRRDEAGNLFLKSLGKEEFPLNLKSTGCVGGEFISDSFTGDDGNYHTETKGVITFCLMEGKRVYLSTYWYKFSGSNSKTGYSPYTSEVFPYGNGLDIKTWQPTDLNKEI